MVNSVRPNSITHEIITAIVSVGGAMKLSDPPKHNMEDNGNFDFAPRNLPPLRTK